MEFIVQTKNASGFLRAPPAVRTLGTPLLDAIMRSNLHGLQRRCCMHC